MSDPGCVQLTRPVPDASACSASNPSAIRPVAATAAPPPPGAVTVATVPGAVTVTGRGAFAGADDLPLAVLPEDVLPPLAAAGVARTAVNVAAPLDVADPELTDPALAGGSASIEIRAVPAPGAAGGQDLVTDVTAALWPPCAAALDVPGWVTQAITKTRTSASSTAPGSAKRDVARRGISALRPR
jgi:hypothetical protein